MIGSVLSGYALVFFSTEPLVGFLFMLATFVIPAQGLAGLSCLVLANLLARLLGFPREDIKAGYYAYNGLLTGLALGLTYQINGPFILMLLIAGLLGVLIAAALQAFFRHYLFVPVLSGPFVLTTWLALAAGQHFHGLIYTLAPFETGFQARFFPETLEFFLRSLGATFFQLTGIAGLLIGIGLLLYSRLALILSIIGLCTGTLVYTLLRGDPTDLHRNLIGFNFVLTAIAVGGVWTIPGWSSLILAAAGSALCAVIAAASATLLTPLALPALAFPFIVTTGILIYSLRQRAGATRFQTLLLPEKSPEMNVKRQRSARMRFLNPQAPAFVLPVSGEWIITQGVQGEHTHKQAWSHAWDFEIHDQSSRPFRGDGLAPEDFYAFNMPVFAPAEGKVVNVVSHIEDNPIGHVNTEENWGNLVILWHYGRVYTAFCHLRRGSVTVNEGDSVRQGQVIGKVGNSGRSTVPHLHFHAQGNPDVGAASIEAELLHYVTSAGALNHYHIHGVPGQGERVRAMAEDDRVFRAAGFPLGRAWEFEVSCGGREWQEKWETEIDFPGNRFLVCRSRRARIRYLVNRCVLLLLDYEGVRDTGLYWLFLGLPRLPLTSQGVTWNDELAGGIMLSPAKRLVSELLEPFCPAARVRTASGFSRTGASFTVVTELTQTGPLAGRRLRNVQITTSFDLHKGPLTITAECGGERVFALRQGLSSVGAEGQREPNRPLPVSMNT